MDNFDTVIIGGGLSGIGAYNAIGAQKKLLIERDQELLGHAKSHLFDGQMFDEGAHICHSTKSTWLNLLNLKDVIKREHSVVKNFSNGKWLGYPVQNSLSDLETDEKELAYQQIIAGIEQPKREFKDYGDWCEKTYGSFLTSKYYDVFTKKYWRTNMSDMGTDWLNGRLLPVNREAVKSGYEGYLKNQAVFSRFLYPSKGGFAGFFEKIKTGVSEKECVLGVGVKSIDQVKKNVTLDDGREYKYVNLISTIPIPALVKLFHKKSAKLIMLANKLKYTSLFTLGVEITHEECAILPDWFYVYDDDIDISRVFNNGKFTSKNSKKFLQCESYRRNDEEKCEKEIRLAMLAGIQKILKRTVSQNHYYKTTEFSYPVPLKDRKKTVCEIKNELLPLNILTTGLYGTWEYKWSDQAYLDTQKDTLRFLESR